MIPIGWKKRTLESLSCKKISYGIVQTGEPVESGVRCLRVVDITKGRINFEDLITTSKEISQSYKRTLLEKGEIVLALRGEIGRSVLVDGDLVGCNLTRGLARIAPNGEVASEFLLHMLHSPLVQQEFHLRTNGSALQEIPINGLRRVSILVPPPIEQTKIANILSTWDQAIDLSEGLIARKQNQQLALMQQLLTGEVRFNQFVISSERHKTPVGEMPLDWERTPLASIISKVKRKNPEGETHVLTASGEHGLVDQKEFFNRAVASRDLSGYYLLKRGEFAYNRSSMKGYPFGAIKRLERYPQGVLSTLYICFALKDESRYDPEFLAHYFEARLLDQQLREVTQVGGRAHGLLNITDSDFYSMYVILPGLDEQRSIAAVLDGQDREIDLLKRKLEALNQQKRGLMQQLLTGKVRVKVSNEFPGE